MIKTRPIADIITQDKPIRPSKEVAGKTPEPFLSGRVPELEPHGCSFDFDHFVSVVDSDGGDEFGGEDVLVEAEDE